MSFILDALRKSEHERQINAGQNMGLLYQVVIKRNHNPWIIPAAIIVATLILIALIWRIWLQPNPTNATTLNTSHDMISVSPQQSITQQKSTDTKPPHEKHPSGNTRKNIPATQDTVVTSPAANLENIPAKSSADPLKGLPPLHIAGYVHNEQSGTVAMINNQLVHEGEEISPGLRLIKILDNSAIFSYKGYIFTR